MSMPSKLSTSKTKFGIVGFGQFGSFLTELLVRFTAGEILVATRSAIDYKHDRVRSGSYELLAECDYIFPCVPISVLKSVLVQIKPLLKAEVVVIDVSSLKVFPKEAFSEILPNIQVVLTHPMFGPGTVAQRQGNVSGLRITLENLSCPDNLYQDLKHFFAQDVLLDVVEVDADTHDKQAARFQFISQYCNQMLKPLELIEGEIDTGSYRQLLAFTKMVQADKRLLSEMLTYNPYCAATLADIIQAQSALNTELQTL